MAIPEDLWRVPLRILLTVVVSLIVYVCWKCAFALFQVFQELFVLATISAGHAWSPKGKSMRMHPYFCQTSKLDDYVVDECYRFHASAFDIAMPMEMEKKKAVYRRVLMSYSHILLCRDREDGSLRATIFIGVDRKKSYTIVKIGMMLCHAQYRGGPWMKLATAILIIRELCLHPLTPLYMLGKVSTYKAYIELYENHEFYPRYDKETPELYKKIAEDYAVDMKNSSDTYDRDNLILRRRLGIVREGVAPITERELRDPRIRFFSERNHGWREGDQMLLVLRLLWSDLLRSLALIFKYSLLLKKKPKYTDTLNAKRGTKQRCKLKRGMTFQDATADLYTDRFSVYEFAESGETTGTSLSNHPLSPSPKSPTGKNFVFKGERSTAVDDEPEYDINFPF